jgi:tetratricopeptide (TPR) repeat protein
MKDRGMAAWFQPLAAGIGLLSLTVACAGRHVQPEPSSEPAAPAVEVETQQKATTDVSKRNVEASAEYHFAMAQAYVSEGNPDRAIEEYKLTLLYDPNSALVYARLATEYIKKGQLSAAMESCKEALRRDADFVDARLMLAGLYSTTHDAASALVEYDKILKADPKHEEAIVYKAQVLVEDGKAPEAIQSLRGFLKRNTDSPLVWYYLGRAEQHEENLDDAAAAYKKALEVRPGFSQASLALGALYEERRMNEKALEVYGDLYDDSQDLSAANRIATILLKQEKYREAVPYLEAIEAGDPDDMNVRVKLGLVHMELKNFEKSISVFTEILSKNPDSDRIHYYLGSLYEETKSVDLAIAQLKMIKPESRLFSDAALHVAYLLKQEKKVDEAKAAIAEAIQKAPRVAPFYIFQASLAEEAKDYPGAVTILETAVKLFPEDEKIRYYLGSLYDRQGDSDKGLEQMEAILALNAQNVDALNYIGYTYTQKGIRLNDAERLLKRALGLRPDNGYIQDSWGWYLFVRGRVDEAVVELEKAAKLKPNETTILEHLGDAYLRSNLREKALVRYQDAAKYAEDADTKRKIQLKVDNLREELAQHAGPSSPSGRSPAGESPAP